jgi:predicted phage terminase large subunit-like protein
VKVIVEKAIGDDGKALWEEKFPLEFLLKKKKDAGSVIFGMQYQNDAELAKGEVFKIEWIKFHDISLSDTLQTRAGGGKSPGIQSSEARNSALEHGSLIFYQGVDPAISQGSRADYFAVVTIGLDRDRQIFIADSFRARLSFAQQVRTIKEKIVQFSPIVVGIESVAYQEALSQSLRSICRNLPEGVSAPAIRSVSQTKDKQTRALRLSALFENGTLYLGKNQNELLEELLLFPSGAHDDLIDALEIAVRVSQRFKSACSTVPGI